MNATFNFKQLAACALLCSTGAAFAHVTLPPGGGTAGSEYDAAFRVGHACKEAKSTTGITVRLPKGFGFTDAQARKGWKLDVQKAAGDSGGEVRWTAESAQTALPGSERAEFIVRGKLPAAPGVLWFKVLQTCDNGSADWAQVPASGVSTEGLESPAARLDVLAPGVAAVDVRDAWIRASVPGQSGTGAFMKLSAPSGARLVGASTPAAGVAEVHEMKMEGDTMRMRAAGALDLPARQTVELKPGGYHLMLMDLKKALVKDSTVPLTLLFEDAKGQKSTKELEVPVLAGAAAPAGGEHKH
ncbi:copper chaperone PCu(A)C [Variovorax sp. GT1P44]|uniref:copper chaperone PCu(A)C n=1 Tax=Variovorax sp. GT1P44 TaxID=3443742 RepID=UPI003F452548